MTVECCNTQSYATFFKLLNNDIPVDGGEGLASLNTTQPTG